MEVDRKLNDDEVVAGVVADLRRIYGKDIPEPTAVTVTHWSNDEFARGVYSYIAVGASGEDYDVLAKPVEDTLFFAGEATNREHPSTIAGAFHSGLREAGRIDRLSCFSLEKMAYEEPQFRKMKEKKLADRGAKVRTRMGQVIVVHRTAI